MSIWLATMAFAMVLLVGLAVDLGGQVHAQQRARALAAEAARTGGQQLDAAAAVRGDAVRADTLQAGRAASTYLTAAGVHGTVTVTGGTLVTVDVTDTYRTTFLGVIGITTLPVTGHGTARLTRSVGGLEQ
ncbi:pilus assembly protein TadG-related protein [Phycicoccus flavus]|uniref:pilus assembly protein TadG-related protein n=1 Tax=Phycicoccus flavus TaxID=2502783 RepID=UPI000FEB7674|nr:pilus assembly protein TadG-related protein [Phycicoccus flavus]NHA68226.1 pilus assembly protein [Phycicoccus flavus]